MNLLLIGLRGSGKSTLGRALARRLGREFVDLDDLTPKLLNAPTLAEAWTTRGEAAFRRAEVGALTELLAHSTDRVIALGGGTPAAPGAPDLLHAQIIQGRILLVYLAAEPATLRARMEQSDNTHRPSLTGADPLIEIDAVHAKRDPLYRRIADEVLDTDDLTVDEAIEALAALAQ